MPARRVLGIDPGSRRLGWGVVERRGPALRALAAGVLQLDPAEPLEARLVEVHETIAALLDTHQPDTVAIEDVFYARFPRAAIQLAHVRGVILLAAAQAEREVVSHPPALVKRTIAGRGAADKTQIARMVAATLRLRQAPPADAADALAIALTELARLPAPAPGRAPR
jgi:crossover junction endodeoxyribonuclease RuvC